MVAIAVSGVSKSFKNLRALRDISLTIEEGEFFGLLGANGAGKSTLINIIGGLTRADMGIVQIGGFDVGSEYAKTRRMLGIVPQELVYDPFFTVREMLRLQSGYFGMGRNDDWIDEILIELNLTDKQESNIQSLSGGMKRRLLIAQALVHKPPVLILDEPTAGVDVDLRRNLWNFARKLNQQGTTIVLTTHYLEEAEQLCGRIAVLNRGKLISIGAQDTLLAQHRFRHVQLKTSLIPDWVKDYPHEIVGETLSITVDAEDEVSDVVAGFVSAGLSLDTLEIKRPRLEDVFVTMLEKDRG
jgi:ABC-2 type transport system ATP-binding protein